jgi:hypothetical protein
MTPPTNHRLSRVASALAALCLLSTSAAGCGETTYEFDDLGVGDDDQGRTPRSRSNSQFVRAVYADLLGRAPETYDFVVENAGSELFRFPIDEQQQLLGVLDGIGDPTPLRDLMVAGLVSSDELELPDKNDVSDPEQFITDQFRQFLGRDPAIYELESFVGEWDSDPAVNPRTIIRALLSSREYQSF